MALQPANHHVISGKGSDAIIDTAGITGGPGRNELGTEVGTRDRVAAVFTELALAV